MEFHKFDIARGVSYIDLNTPTSDLTTFSKNGGIHEGQVVHRSSQATKE